MEPVTAEQSAATAAPMHRSSEADTRDDALSPVDSEAGLLRGRSAGLIISAAILFTVLVCASQTFLSVYTMTVISRQIAFFALVALAQAVCLVVGGMNLSVGAIGAFCTVMLGLCMQRVGLSGWAAVPSVLILGALAGAFNGLLIVKLKIDSFIVTLSMMFVYMGLRSGISSGAPYALPDSFTLIGQGSVMGIPYVFLVMAAVLIMAGYVFRWTVFGRYLLATGGNIDAARLSGIKTNNMIVWANLLSGLLAALAAVLWSSKLGSAAPETGDNWLIISFAVAIIGGTGLSGGVISIAGLFMGATIFMLIKYGLVELRANDYYANSFLGGLILLAIVVDRLREIQGERSRS
jgi:ribose transport system permease protein